MRMSSWEGLQLETILKATGRYIPDRTGRWTQHSSNTRAAPAADNGFHVSCPRGLLFDH